MSAHDSLGIMNQLKPLRRRLNPSQALLAAGLLLSLLVIMFRPAGADAVLPKTADVFPTHDDSETPATVSFGDLPKVTADYNVLLKGEKKPATVTLTGIPLVEFLKAGGVKTDNVGFVRIRFGTSDDSLLTLQPLDQQSPERPPIVLSSGKKPGVGPFATPQIIPSQPSLDQAIRERDFIPFKASGPRLKFLPAQAGAKIMSIRIDSKKLSSGEYKLTARVHAGSSGGAKQYQWFGFDAKGQPVKLTSGPTITTTNATTGSAEHVMNVVVTETGTGSMGQAGYKYNSKKKEKGSTKNPYPPAKGGGAGGTGGGTGTGTGTGTPGGTTTITPPGVLGTPQTTPPPQTSITPAPSPVTPAPATPTTVDTTAITNVAQNFTGAGGLRTVSGVLLSAPSTPPAAASAGGNPLSALPAPVASELNTLFKPVEGADEVWAYLLAVLFAFSISGAVREWVKP